MIYALGGTARWLQLQPSSSWPWGRKRSKLYSLCSTRVTHTIRLGCFKILDFHFKIVFGLCRRYLIPTRCNNGKSKIWPWRWLHHSYFQHWRWLHALMTMVASVLGVFFDKHTANPLQTNMHVGCMIVVKCDTCKIFGTYGKLTCIARSIVCNVGTGQSMQVTHSHISII